MTENEPHQLITTLQKNTTFENAREIITIDELRVEYTDNFDLMHPSNTTPIIMLHFETNSAETLQHIQAQFHAIILTAAPNLRLPF